MVNNNDYVILESWRLFCQQRGRVISEELLRQQIGLKNDQILRNLFPDQDFDAATVDAFSDEKEQLYRQVYAPHICEVPGLLDFMGALRTISIPAAVASLAPLKNREFVFEKLGISVEWFGAIVGDEHVTHGKPHPEIYLRAAEQLGIDPAGCVAFEDSYAGIASAKAAGMTVIALTTNHHAEELRQRAGADFAVTNFYEAAQLFVGL
jgi:beta-phosphoglucomutase-like phosphatase (HAD superfamily)